MSNTKQDWVVSSSTIVVDLGSGKIVANTLPTGIPSLDFTLEEAIEHAALIAAAPDLLAACKEMQAALTEHHLRDVKKRFSLCVADSAMNRAIAKAEQTN